MGRPGDGGSRRRLPYSSGVTTLAAVELSLECLVPSFVVADPADPPPVKESGGGGCRNSLNRSAWSESYRSVILDVVTGAGSGNDGNITGRL